MPLSTSLVQGLVFDFVAPCAFYLVGAIWFKITGGLTPTKQKVLLSTTIGFILYGLALSGTAEADTLKLLWLQSPYLWSLVYLVFVASVVGGAAVILVRLWKPNDPARAGRDV